MSENKIESIKTNSVIECTNLSVQYDGYIHALKKININLEKNTVTALIGPSGCGKSTFLRCLNRMNDFIPNCKIKGKVMMGDINIYSANVDPVEVRLKVGMVFQQANPFPRSISDNITLAPRLNGYNGNLKELLKESLEKAYLWDEVKDILDRNAYSLSGGQQQRLCIARAIAMSPEVLLMDEPTSALDPISTRKIEDLINELKKSYTIVIVTHNMQQAARIGDFTAFFYQGVLVEYGDTKKIFSEPVQQLTQDYVMGRFG